MKKKFLDFSFFRKDLLGGITAGIVALPLALAFGEQSGMGAAAGLYGAAFIAFFASLFGGTPTQISGPTAPMTALSMVVIAGILKTFEGRLEEAIPVILAVFLLAGIFQIIMGLLKLGTYIKFIPQTVVSGFMSGIGVIILITQILPAVGYYSGNDTEVIDKFKPHAEELILDRILAEEAQDGILVLEEFNETIERAQGITKGDIIIEAKLLAKTDSKGVKGSLRYVKKALANISWLELLLALSTIAIIYLFPKITRAIPSTLVSLVVVSGVAIFAGWDYALISEIPSGYPTFRADVFTGFDFGAIRPYILTALILAMLGAIDSLLTSVVADNLTKTRHDPNQELIGQGVGNGIASMFAGLPGAGATIRTVVNIKAGGKTKISGMVAGILLFVILLFLGPIASKVPAAVLAGILITVGIGVMDYKGLRALRKMSRSDAFILLLVLVLTVFWQLVYAVLVGLVLAAFVFMKRMSDIYSQRSKVISLDQTQEGDILWEDELSLPEDLRSKVMFKHLHGPMFFGMANDFRATISEIDNLHVLVLRMEKVPFIDQSGLYALESALDELRARQVMVVISGLAEQPRDILEDMDILGDKIKHRHVFERFKDCRPWMIEMLRDEASLKEELLSLGYEM